MMSKYIRAMRLGVPHSALANMMEQHCLRVLNHAAILQTADHLPVLYCLLASLQWKRLPSTVWQHRLLD